MALTDTQIKNAKPRPISYKLSDDQGLALLITPSGGRLWRYRYNFERREKMIGLGSYAGMGLKEARERRDAARKMLEGGVNPSSARLEARSSRKHVTTISVCQ